MKEKKTKQQAWEGTKGRPAKLDLAGITVSGKSRLAKHQKPCTF